MLNYLKDLLEGTEPFTVTIYGSDASYYRVGVYAVDDLGIDFNTPGGRTLMPWTSIKAIRIDD